MQTLFQDSNFHLPGVRRLGQRQHFLKMAAKIGHSVVDEVSSLPAVQAYLNHARWLADCPFCNGAELVTADNPVFLCLSCGNEQAGGRLLSVTFPSNQKMRDLERVLTVRQKENQNWETHESIEFLELENQHYLERGIRVK